LNIIGGVLLFLVFSCKETRVCSLDHLLEKNKFLPGFVIVSDAAWRVGGKTVRALGERERKIEWFWVLGFLLFCWGRGLVNYR
jgi:hypothetical protein